MLAIKFQDWSLLLWWWCCNCQYLNNFEQGSSEFPGDTLAPPPSQAFSDYQEYYDRYLSSNSTPLVLHLAIMHYYAIMQNFKNDFFTKNIQKGFPTPTTRLPLPSLSGPHTLITHWRLVDSLSIWRKIIPNPIWNCSLHSFKFSPIPWCWTQVEEAFQSFPGNYDLKKAIC